MKPTPRPAPCRLRPWTGLVLAALLSGGGCGGAVPGEAAEDFVPPVLLSAPEGRSLPAGGVREELSRSARHLRAELQHFADTASSHVRSFPAARCCPRVLHDLLAGAHRWDAAAPGAPELVPLLERLVNEPRLQEAPGLVDLVLHRISRGHPSDPVPPPTPGPGGL